MLSPEFLTQLEHFRIQCRKPFRGKFRGERRSLNRGTGLEFADYRLYKHGDDLRYLDWNAYARLEKLFIKLFQADEELPVTILIDTSKSMTFGEPTKLDYAKQLAAALGYIALANSDRVTLYTLSDRLSPTIPSLYGKSQYSRLQKALTTVEAGGTTQLTTCLKQLATFQPQASVVIILSDYLDPEGYIDGINSLIGRGFALTLLHIQCPEEIEPPPTGDWRLEDAETGETKEITINEEAIAHYLDRQKEFCENIQRFCTARGIGYDRISTEIPIEVMILEHLQHICFLQRRY